MTKPAKYSFQWFLQKFSLLFNNPQEFKARIYKKIKSRTNEKQTQKKEDITKTLIPQDIEYYSCKKCKNNTFYIVLDIYDEKEKCKLLANKLGFNLIIFNLSITQKISDLDFFAISKHQEYLNILQQLLHSVEKPFSGLLVTNDIHPAFRNAVDLFNQLKIPTFLFLSENSYGNESHYIDTKYGYSKPIANHVYVMSEHQKDLLIERGLLPHKIMLIGDILEQTTEMISYDKNYLNKYLSLNRFRQNLLLSFGEGEESSEFLQKLLEVSGLIKEKFNIDIYLYLSSQSIKKLSASFLKKNFQTIGDTMFEKNYSSLVKSFDMIITDQHDTLLYAMDTKAIFFSSSNAKNRLFAYNNTVEVHKMNDCMKAIAALHDLSVDKVQEERPTALLAKSISKEYLKLLSDEFSTREPVDIVSLDSDYSRIGLVMSISPNIYTNFKYTDIMLDTDSLVYMKNGREDVDEVAFWGLGLNETAQNIKENIIKRGVPYYHLENGFITSQGLTVVDEYPSLSILKDHKNLYFDALRGSELEDMINTMEELYSEESQKMDAIISKIVDNYITKYNHAPIFKPNVGREGRKKVLVIDQRYGDKSIEYGMANAQTFKDMLDAAASENPEADIIVKVHPDAIIGGKEGHYYDIEQTESLYLYGEDINPIVLLQYIDKVYVCTSQMGFEALMCGKDVVCFGVPFYSGWGLTDDRNDCGRRGQKRSLQQIFKAAYIDYSTYMDPRTNRICELTDMLEYLCGELSKRVMETKKDITFFANRGDGLGQRLLPIIEAFYLSNIFGGQVKCTWNEKLCKEACSSVLLPESIEETNTIFHNIKGEYNIFSDNFQSEHIVDEEYMDGRNIIDLNKEDLPSINMNRLAILKDPVFICSNKLQKSLGNQFFPKNNDFSNAYKWINYSKPIQKAVEFAHNLSLPSKPIAIHIRGGDLIYGMFRFNERFQNKAMPIPIAKQLIRDYQAQGFNIIIFSQDKEVNDLFSKDPSLIVIDNLIDNRWDKNQQAFIEMTSMSRCEMIFGSDSAFSEVASLMQGKVLKTIYDIYTKSRLSKIIRDDLKEYAADYSPLQKAYLHFMTVLFDPKMDHQEIDTRMTIAFNNDPENHLYTLKRILNCLKHSEHQKAEKILEDIYAHETTKLTDHQIITILFEKRADGVFVLNKYFKYFLEEFNKTLVLLNAISMYLFLQLGDKDKANNISDKIDFNGSKYANIL